MRSCPLATSSCARAKASASCAKARGVSRYTLRENWSSTKTSAKRPSGVARQANNSHRAAASSVAPKRVRMAWSKAASLAKWCLGVSSVNQKWKILWHEIHIDSCHSLREHDKDDYMEIPAYLIGQSYFHCVFVFLQKLRKNTILIYCPAWCIESCL